MKICIFGLWHLGCVTAACVAQAGIDVVGLDPDSKTIELLNRGKAPIFEPGLEALIQEGLKSKRLQFTDSASVALTNTEALWVTFDTPVNDQDEADSDSVKKQIENLFDKLQDGMTVIISSQVPVGFGRKLEESFKSKYPKRHVRFCSSPENLRLGKALEAFQKADRMIIGVRHPDDRSVLEPLFSHLCKNLEWMSVESAEMTKHAINSFLATSAVFANELGVLCEFSEADPAEVERGLKTDSRIGPKAYLRPGAPIAGGTLARDVRYLTRLGDQSHFPAYLLKSVLESNQYHADWVKRKLREKLNTFKGRRIAILGLTYKTGTDTLRRSWAIDLCRWLHSQGAILQAFEPSLQTLPTDLTQIISLKNDLASALDHCDCAVVCTDHPAIKQIQATLIGHLERPLIIDPDRTLPKTLVDSLRSVEYFSVGFSRVNEKVS